MRYTRTRSCVEHSSGRADFRPSRDGADTIARSLGGPLTCLDALGTIRKYLDQTTAAADESVRDIRTNEVSSGDGEVDSPEEGTARNGQSNRLFDEAVSVPLGRRLDERLAQWRQQEGRNTQTDIFQERIRRLLDMGEEGRKFGRLSILDEDLAGIRNDLEVLEVPRRPQDMIERAQACRNLTSIEFRLADASLYRQVRRCWLVSAFWNSSLTELWATNIDQFVLDVLGYLTVAQAEHRYATHAEGVLLLLRVSHLICRIASSEELVPANFYEKSGRIEDWVRYTVGTVLAISGPGRVPPSRIRNDPRFVDKNGNERGRDEFGAILLPLWRAPDQRVAACAILLELANWKLAGATRLLRTTLEDAKAEYEVWERDLADVVSRASRVKVLRPNPWAEASVGKLVTADTHALAVLASDVIHRTFPALESNISLNGTSFRERRVPTFVCSADFGPLGLFKADARERITREAENFIRYAQRLHPRYRASRCDPSVAAISEPDDRIEFVGGLLTSYVFTAREAPRSLNSWFQNSDVHVVLGLVDELFREAVRPWYQHARLGVLDITSEYELFSSAGLVRLSVGLSARGDLTDADMTAVRWLESIVGWVTGEQLQVDKLVQEQAADLQLCDTLRAVTHGDLHLDNVMVLGKPGAEYPCIIDFETTSESHLLRDFGRFTGAVLFRTHDWTPEESMQIQAALSRGMSSDYQKIAPPGDGDSVRVTKALQVIGTAWDAFVQ